MKNSWRKTSVQRETIRNNALKERKRWALKMARRGVPNLKSEVWDCKLNDTWYSLAIHKSFVVWQLRATSALDRNGHPALHLWIESSLFQQATSQLCHHISNDSLLDCVEAPFPSGMWHMAMLLSCPLISWRTLNQKIQSQSCTSQMDSIQHTVTHQCNSWV